MAVGVTSQAVGHAAGDDAGQGPSGVAGGEEPIPAEGVRELEVEGKGAGPSEGAPAVIAVEGGKEEEEEEEEEEEADTAVEAETKDEEGDAGDDEEGEKLLGCYSSTQNILLVGDGDFSFSLALATAFRSGTNIVATSLDTYGSSRFLLLALARNCVKVLVFAVTHTWVNA
jgi:25S rRNA (uracil2634-N3)-methyltransferase